MRVLLVEDHRRLASLITKGLKAAYIDVDSVETVAEAIETLATRHYDAALLDLGLPDGDGLEVLRELRDSDNPMPVLILTSRVQVADRVKGLNAGADDYLTKPFAMDELVARIHALLRRPQTALGHVLRTGDVTLDTVTRETRVGDSPINVSIREAQVLEQLMRRENRVVPKSLLEQSLYGIDDELASNSVEVIIHRVRKKLADANADAVVHTVRGVGYMIMVPSEQPPR